MQATTADGTATRGNDYTRVDRTVSIPTGSRSTTVSVPIADDTTDENDETFTLSISNPPNANLGSTTTATATIRDNDSPQFLGSVTNLTAACVDGEVTITWGPPVGGSVNDYRWGLYRDVYLVRRLSRGTTTATSASVTVTDTTLTYYAEVQARGGLNPNQASWLPTGGFICTVSPPVVSLPGAPLAVTEGSTVQVTATLDKAATGSAAVQFSTSGAIGGTGACSTGANFTVNRTSFVFNTGDTTANITLTACPDSDTTDESVTVSLTTNGISGLELGSPTTVLVNIADTTPASTPLLK